MPTTTEYPSCTACCASLTGTGHFDLEGCGCDLNYPYSSPTLPVLPGTLYLNLTQGPCVGSFPLVFSQSTLFWSSGDGDYSSLGLAMCNSGGCYFAANFSCQNYFILNILMWNGTNWIGGLDWDGRGISLNISLVLASCVPWYAPFDDTTNAALYPHDCNGVVVPALIGNLSQ